MLLTILCVSCGNISEALEPLPQPPITGGYQDSEINPQVLSAAKFAVSREQQKRGTRLSLISVERAETQVVAGVNYRLCLRVKIKGKAQKVRTVIYQDLKQRFSLSSWKLENCSKK